MSCFRPFSVNKYYEIKDSKYFVLIRNFEQLRFISYFWKEKSRPSAIGVFQQLLQIETHCFVHLEYEKARIGSTMISNAVKFTFFTILLTATAAICFGQSAGAPPIYEVKFEKGVFIHKGTVHPVYPCAPNGPTECGNGSSTSLSIKAAKGERIRIVLTSDTGDAVFSILTPNREAMKNSSSITSWTGTFSSGGDYPIYVYANKSFTHYMLKVVRL
jgi:hypothetical protein